MCGISGVYNFKNPGTVSEWELTKMRDTLIHRGPDGGANYVSPDGKVGLSQRRLAIIDLSNEAACPMANEDGTVWITYNGEIYNFKPLREELIKKGHRLKTHGDTEVILHGYEEWGEKIVERLNGMFAFVIWDENKKILFAARDHVGIKPFYYAIQNGAFYFGSEIKAILAHPNFRKELNEDGLSLFLSFASTPAPLTTFKDVRKLPPANFLTVKKDGDVKESEYWNPITAGAGPKTDEEYAGQITGILRNSIKDQMVSDVPFGCFLSGGIDSSTNATLMSEALGKPVETFSIGAPSYQKYNEFKYSRLIASKIGAKPHELTISENDLYGFMEQSPYFADDPNGDQVCFPLFWLSKFAKENGVTVIQIGEGADELFAGYDVYLKANRLYRNVWKSLERLPRSIIHSSLNILNLSGNPKLDFSKSFLSRLMNRQEPFWGYANAFTDYQKDGLMSEHFKKTASPSSAYAVVKEKMREVEKLDPSADFIEKITYLELKNRLPEVLLMRADKMTMAHSIEGRVPFLDKRLVELAFQIPTEQKIRNNDPKHILKKAVTGIIPGEIIHRKKQGFASPISEWLERESLISDRIFSIIRNSKIHERGLLNRAYIERLISSHQKGKVDFNFQIWNLLVISLWYDHWFSK